VPVRGEIPPFNRGGLLLGLSPKFRVSQLSLHAIVRLIVFSAADLTTSVKRLNNVHLITGGYALVHRCKLDLKDIDVVQQMVFRYQSPLMSTCVYVGALSVILFCLPHGNLGRSQGNNVEEYGLHVVDYQCQYS